MHDGTVSATEWEKNKFTGVFFNLNGTKWNHSKTRFEWFPLVADRLWDEVNASHSVIFKYNYKSDVHLIFCSGRKENTHIQV